MDVPDDYFEYSIEYCPAFTEHLLQIEEDAFLDSWDGTVLDYNAKSWRVQLGLVKPLT